MGLTPTFTKADIKRAIKQKVDAYREAVIDRLKYAGEQFVNLARENHEYIDQTGNLTSSIGYMVLYNGKIKAQAFEGQKAEGKKQGKKIAKQIADEYPEGFSLIGVAGMDYAAKVEAKGKDVINSSANKVEELLKESMKRLNKNFNG